MDFVNLPSTFKAVFAKPLNQSKDMTSSYPLDIFEIYPYWDRLCLKLSILVIGLVMELLSLVLSEAIRRYEMFSGDPQKRTIVNQLLSHLCALSVLNNLVPFNIILLAISCGHLPEIVVSLLLDVPNAAIGLASMLSLNEQIILKALSIFYWKRVPPLN